MRPTVFEIPTTIGPWWLYTLFLLVTLKEGDKHKKSTQMYNFLNTKKIWGHILSKTLSHKSIGIKVAWTQFEVIPVERFDEQFRRLRKEKKCIYNGVCVRLHFRHTVIIILNTRDQYKNHLSRAAFTRTHRAAIINIATACVSQPRR